MSDYEYFYSDSQKTINDLRRDIDVWRKLARDSVSKCTRKDVYAMCIHCTAIKQIKELSGEGEWQ